MIRNFKKDLRPWATQLRKLRKLCSHMIHMIVHEADNEADSIGFFWELDSVDSISSDFASMQALRAKLPSSVSLVDDFCLSEPKVEAKRSLNGLNGVTMIDPIDQK